MLPLSRLPQRSLSQCPVLLSDVDGTLTTGGELESSTIRALEKLRDQRVPVILVTGRPAGYAELLTRYLPVRGVVAENGGLWFLRDPDGKIHKAYAETDETRDSWRQHLINKVELVLAEFPGAKLSTDSAYTEVNLAIDYAEQVHLDAETARQIERACLRRGLYAVRSSVHINVWATPFNKLNSSLILLRQVFGLTAKEARAQALYVGDSFNDAPMFRAFLHSVGVAQVLELGKELRHAPRYVTPAREAAGARQLLAALSRSRPRV